MKKTKMAIITTIFGLIIIIIIGTTIKLIDKNRDKEYNYTVNKIIKATKRCIEESTCPEENTTLKTLYEKLDIEEYINPLTNKPFNHNSYVTVNTYEFITK